MLNLGSPPRWSCHAHPRSSGKSLEHEQRMHKITILFFSALLQSGWRPSLSGRRPSLLGWMPSLLVRLEAIAINLFGTWEIWRPHCVPLPSTSAKVSRGDGPQQTGTKQQRSLKNDYAYNFFICKGQNPWLEKDQKRSKQSQMEKSKSKKSMK